MIDNIQLITDICEGIKETKNNDSIFIYPNPTNDLLFIQRNINTLNEKIQIFDFTGHLVFENINYSGENINIKQLNNGVYILKYSDTKAYSINKFIIEK
jgi:hypothetical protein